MHSYFIYFNRLIKSIIPIIIALVWLSCSGGKVRSDNNFLVANKTLSKKDSASLHFFVLGDWGFNGSKDQEKVESEMIQISKLVGLNFILTCGDNFQYAGVKSIRDTLWHSNFEDVYNDSSLLVPWYPSLGNHDYRGDPDTEVEYSTINKHWVMPGRYYSFVKEINSSCSVRFIVLDTYGLIQEYRKLTDKTKYDNIVQYAWFKNLLSGARDKWIIVTGHYSVFSTGYRHGDTKELKILIKPLLDEYKVDFYISGHDHDFEHVREKDKSTDYIVTGTGGLARLVGHNDKTVYALSALGFSYFSLAQDSAKLYFITSDGFIGYSYVRKKNTK
ncbi:MAG: metallophosphoesterase [Bacteroidia bacterium]|nr:metallophosphoesterase [Bacteroidia bacterium]